MARIACGSVQELDTTVRAPHARPGRSHFRIGSGTDRPPAWQLLLGLGELHELRMRARDIEDPFALARFALDSLEVAVQVDEEELARVPQSGPLVVVANHPFGALDGLCAISTLGRRRTDVAVLANSELARLDALARIVIPIDPFGGGASRDVNVAGLRRALRHLGSGGALLVFPAGEVAHLDLRRLHVADPPWTNTAVRLARRVGAFVLPMHFDGANSAIFQLAGLLHPLLRTALLPRELARCAGRSVCLRIGRIVEPRTLAAFPTDAAATAHLRIATHLLGSAAPDERAAAAGNASEIRERTPEPLAPEAPADALEREVESLPPERLLLASGPHRVYCAPASEVPQALREIGRLREIAFRAVGEGTGRAADTDRFDAHYEHLFVWHGPRREIVGAYRLGRVDEIRRRLGIGGLYTATLFEYREPFIALLGPALELGRSFVRPEHQRGFAPLMLLWKGIGEYVARNPRYARLIGPVSISNDYLALSRELLVRYLHARSFDALGATFVRARRPFRRSASLRALGHELTLLEGLDALGSVIADLEPDRKGVPVLLRQYLKLGGRILGFNIDPDFGHSIDCLILVDLRRSDPKTLARYVPADGLRRLQRLR
jgi:putative hemolysin